MDTPSPHRNGQISVCAALALTGLFVAGLAVSPFAQADNRRLNESVYSNLYTVQKHNNCPAELRLDPRLTDAARRHALDVRDNSHINGPIGSDGSAPQDRARQAGFDGHVAEIIAINPALAINGMEVLNRWWHDPFALQTMRDCTNTTVGVWSENSLNRSVVVAVYGRAGLLP